MSISINKPSIPKSCFPIQVCVKFFLKKKCLVVFYFSGEGSFYCSSYPLLNIYNTLQFLCLFVSIVRYPGVYVGFLTLENNKSLY